MELYLIRHGQSVNNALPDDAPRIQDSPLNDLGKAQAERVAAYLADGSNRDPRYSPATGYSERETMSTFGITHLYTSPMRRALQTTQPIARALNLHPEIWIDIHEHGGVYQARPDGVTAFPGMTSVEIQEQFAGYVLPAGLTAAGWWDVARGAEEYYTALGRAVKVAGELRRRARELAAAPDAPPQRIALVSHGTFIDALIKALLNLLPSRQMFFLMYNTGITRIDFVDNDRLVLRYVNRVTHLPPDMIS
jgi:2,3-bisphosphoglycerate-dependent phosphoglycerate mutase